MKILRVVKLGFLCIFCACVMMVITVSGQTAEKGLVAYYPFDEGSGNVLNDRSGNNNHGKIVGEAKWVKGSFGSTIQFDGKNGYVDCGNDNGLSIGKTGSVLLWFKPENVCQGGLICWTKGQEKPDQRLVISLNTYIRNKGQGTMKYEELGVYTSDAKNSYAPHEGSYCEAYFPPPDKWLHFAVTFNGHSVTIYRDGVLVHSSFQALTPNTMDVPLWIGKCIGMGGASDYFKGLIDEVRVYNRSLSEQEVYQIYMQTGKGRDKDIGNFNSIGIKPIVNPKSGTIFADLNYRGLVQTPKDMTIKAELFNKQKKVVSVGKVRMLPAWGRAEAIFNVQSLKEGDYTIQVAANKGESAEAEVTWPGRAKGWSKIKVLNNLCWELLNESPGNNSKKEYSFTNPRRGWAYFITEVEGNLTLSIANAKPSTIHTPNKVVNQEAMRWLEKGDHLITVSGNGTLKKLIVRSVPTLTFGHYPLVGPGTAIAGDYHHKFLQQHVLPHVNTILSGGGTPYTKNWVQENGGRWIQIVYKPKFGLIAEDIYDDIVKTQGMNDPDIHAIIIDEFPPGNKIAGGVRTHYDAWIEACTKVLEDPKYADHMIIPYGAYNMYDFEKTAKLIRTIVKHDSYFAWEVYLDEQETEGKAWLYINNRLSEQMDDWERAIPCATEHMIVTLSYLMREDWNPEADFKSFLDMQFQHLATQPAMFGIAGIEQYVSHHSNEEYIRCVAKLYRHYALEGHRGRMSDDPYALMHISNCDFAQGTKDWKTEPAEKDSIAVKTQRGYGYLQNRIPYHPFTDTHLLWMRRSKNRPNVFSQQIRNLQPGRLYSVTVATGDYQEFLKGKSAEQVHAVSIHVDNVEPFADWYQKAKCLRGSTHLYAAYALPPFGYQNRYYINIHKYVFRARETTATLSISDWKNNENPCGPIGQELIFNFIQVQPYMEGR
ncbi:MAG: LamG-like jellyroll fold domain-containing protein [bacterium]|nr:LamG-like jellyroll fold domain-containing protein [bacterium]